MSPCTCRPLSPCPEADRLRKAFDKRLEAEADAYVACAPSHVYRKLKRRRMLAVERLEAHSFRAGIVQADVQAALEAEAALDDELFNERLAGPVYDLDDAEGF